LVFGPSPEKRALARSLVIREFPRCPVCKGNSGYDVSGSSLNVFKCNSCQAKWESNALTGNSIASMSLVQPSLYDFRGIELVGVNCDPAFYKTFDASYGGFLKNSRSQMTAQLSSKVSLEIDDELVWSWPGSAWVRVPVALQPLVGQVLPARFAQHAGQLFLTNERLIWLQEGIFNFEVPLEDLTSFIAASTYQGSNESCIMLRSARKNVDAWLKLWLWWGTRANVEIAKDNRAFTRVQGMIFGQQRKKRERVLKEKQREHVQVVLDFSSIRDTLSKGGVVISTFKCPQCSGPLELPETGKQTTCKYCGASIKPVDIFDKIKNIVG